MIEMWKEAVLPVLEVLSRYWHAETEKKREKLQSGYPVSCSRFEPEPSAVRISSLAVFSVFLWEKRRTANISTKVRALIWSRTMYQRKCLRYLRNSSLYELSCDISAANLVCDAVYQPCQTAT